MEKLAELKEKLKELSPEELEELKTFLTDEGNTEEVSEIEKTEEASQAEELKEEKVADESGNAANDESAALKTEPTEETAPEAREDLKAADETSIQSKSEEIPEEMSKGKNEDTETAQQEPAQDDDIPAMQRTALQGGDDAVGEGPITSETGEDIPVDYEQIVEGLNAKIAALTAENASLKNRVEGAFGYSAKTTIIYIQKSKNIKEKLK